MERWSFDPVEGPIRRCNVNQEVIIINDEFINPHSCGNCRALEDRIKNLEASLEQEKKNKCFLKMDPMTFLFTIY